MTKASRSRYTVFGLISKYRGELMGFATLWVVLYHSFINVPDWLPGWLYEPLYTFRMLGYGGVDIFLFVSGIGIYQSLSKNTVSRYFKNRLSRIYPIWGAYIVLMLAVFAIGYRQYFSFKEILGYVTFSGNWSPALKYQGNWYVYTVMLFYLIAPVLYALLKDSKHKTLMCAVLLAAALLGSTAFFSTEWFVQKHYLIAFSRLPVFILGMYVSCALRDTVIKPPHWIVCAVLFIAGVGVMTYLLYRQKHLLWQYGLWWYPFLVIAPTGCLLLSRLFAACEKAFRWWHRALRYVGKASLEIFLISNFIFARFKNATDIKALRMWQAVLIALGAAAAGILFHILIELGRKVVKRIMNKSKA